MAKLDVKIGTVDYTILVFIPDSSSSVGAGKTGLTNTHVDFSYTRVETDNDVVNTTATPASLSALTDAHTDWGFKEVSSTEAPGLYRLDIADGVFAIGAWSAVVSIRDAGANNVAPTSVEFQLVANDPQISILPVKNAALPDIEFLMVDSTDHVTPKTGLTVTGTRSIDGGAFAAVSGSIAAVGNGIYQFDADAADMNGTIITFRFVGTGADDTFLTVKTGG